MKIGQVIRKYRKEKNMTQEEMANCLGVSAPAVNKWENDNSYPDITLLAPIARLLSVSLEELLSFRDKLTDIEIGRLLQELDTLLKKSEFQEAYKWARKKIEEFPNCHKLMIQFAVVLDASRLFREVELPDGFEDYVESMYKRALTSTEDAIRIQAADSLMNYYIRNNRFEEAEKYLEYYSVQNPEKKRKQAQLYYETGQNEKAYKCYEEMLFSDYQKTSAILHGIHLLALKENDFEKAYFIAEKQIALAKVFEMGRYYETSPLLELAELEKDQEKLEWVQKELLDSVEDICIFTRSKLYEHMDFKEVSKEFVEELREELKKQFVSIEREHLS